MKNIHILPTDKPSRLGYLTKKGKEVYKDLRLFDRLISNILDSENQHIYITSDEEIKEEDYFIRDGSIHKCFRVHKKDIEFLTSIGSVYCGSNTFWSKEFCKKIVLTTDQYLIKDGVQAIDDEFLEWLVKNPSCEYVEIEKYFHEVGDNYDYEIIIPSEEPKQETLEEAAREYCRYRENTLEENFAFIDFINGAKWQQEKMYSEEDMRKAIQLARSCTLDKNICDFVDLSGLNELCTYGLKETYSEDSIIQQFKK